MASRARHDSGDITDVRVKEAADTYTLAVASVVRAVTMFAGALSEDQNRVAEVVLLGSRTQEARFDNASSNAAGRTHRTRRDRLLAWQRRRKATMAITVLGHLVPAASASALSEFNSSSSSSSGGGGGGSIRCRSCSTASVLLAGRPPQRDPASLPFTSSTVQAVLALPCTVERKRIQQLQRRKDVVRVVDRLRAAGSLFNSIVRSLPRQQLAKLGALVCAPLSSHLRSATDQLNEADVTVPVRGKLGQSRNTDAAPDTPTTVLYYDTRVRIAEFAIYRLERSARLVASHGKKNYGPRLGLVPDAKTNAASLASKFLAEQRLHPEAASRALELDSHSRISHRIEELQQQFRQEMQVRVACAVRVRGPCAGFHDCVCTARHTGQN